MSNQLIPMEQLKVLVAVAESHSMKEAANQLHKTQPALSQAIKGLESMLGIELFDRSDYRLRLNAQGQVIYQKALTLIEGQQLLLQTAKHFSSGEEERVVLTIDASVEMQPILSALAHTQDRYPATQLVLQQEYLTGSLELVNAGKADLAITVYDSRFVDLEKLDGKRLGLGAMVTVVSDKMLSKFSRLTRVKQLVDEYQVIVQDSGQGTKGSNLGVQTAQRHWYVNDFHAKLALIESGMGWGRLPEHLVKEKLKGGQLQLLELEDYETRVEFDYYLIKSKNKILGPVAEHLWDSMTPKSEED